jgi:hypothetical protein
MEYIRYLLGIGNATAGWIFLLVLSLLGLAGFIHRLRIGVSYLEVFTASYALVILLWTAENDVRLMIPLLPMWPFYIGVTLRELQFDHKWEVCSAITVCITIAFLIRYMGIDTAPIREGLGDASFALL